MRARLKDAVAHIKAAAAIGKKLVGKNAPQSSAPVAPSPAPSTAGAS
jgi:hypothetical protein